MLRFRSATALLCAATLAGCGDDAIQDITAPATGARVKFFHFGVNAPQVNFYANDTKVTAISSATGNESTVGTAYGAVGSGGFYSALQPGQYTFSGRISAATDKNLPIATATATLADGKAYSFYMSGIYDAAAKKADAFVVEDDYSSVIDYQQAYVRLVNASANAGALTMFARNTTTGTEVTLGGPVAYKAAGAFVPVPEGVYDVSLRAAGSTTNAVTRTAVSFNRGRVYTIALRGDMTVTSTTAATRPQLDLTANR